MSTIHKLSLGALGAVVVFGCAFESAEPSEGTGSVASAAKKAGALSTPGLSATSATGSTISIQVCAGETGAPAGFSLQWMTSDAFAGFGGLWPEYTEAQEFCKASFSGNARNSRFPLAPNACTTVEVGNLFDEEPGVSFTCNDDLLCGTDYVFRAFAHATSTLNRSAFTPTLAASTLACGGEACTLTQGYWKNHHDTPGWPVTSLTVGNVTYTDLQLLDIFNKPAQGNGLIALAHQVMAAKLNIANGTDPSAISDALAAADALIGDLVVPPIGSGFLAPNVTSGLNNAITAYNEGGTGPGHCGG